MEVINHCEVMTSSLDFYNVMVSSRLRIDAKQMMLCVATLDTRFLVCLWTTSST